MDDLKRRLAGVYPYSIMGTEHPFGTTAIFSRDSADEDYVLNLQADQPAVVFESEINKDEDNGYFGLFAGIRTSRGQAAGYAGNHHGTYRRPKKTSAADSGGNPKTGRDSYPGMRLQQQRNVQFIQDFSENFE
jgi:hypothetical protein